MSSTPLSSEHVRHNIEQGISACQQLLMMLDSERQALKERDTDRLEQVIRDKSTQLSLLEAGANQRSLWVKQTDSADSGKSTQEQWDLILKKFVPNMQTQWLDFKTLLADCQNQNEINGRLLSRNQQVFARLLSILRGQGSVENTYSAKGAKANSGYRQFLGEA